MIIKIIIVLIIIIKIKNNNNNSNNIYICHVISWMLTGLTTYMTHPVTNLDPVSILGKEFTGKCSDSLSWVNWFDLDRKKTSYTLEPISGTTSTAYMKVYEKKSEIHANWNKNWNVWKEFLLCIACSIILSNMDWCYVSMLLNYPNLNTTFNTLAQTYFQNPSNLVKDWKGALHLFLNLKKMELCRPQLGVTMTKRLSHIISSSLIFNHPTHKKKWKIKLTYPNLSLVWDWNSPTPQATLTFLAGPSGWTTHWLEAMHHLTLHRPCRRQVTPLLDGNAALVGT